MCVKLPCSAAFIGSTLIMALLVANASAQDVKWASTGTGIDDGFRLSAVDTAGNLIGVTGPVQVKWPKLYDITGEVTGLNHGYLGYHQNVIVRYSAEGEILRTLQIESFRYSGVMGIAGQGNTTALLIAAEEDYYEDEDEESFPTGTVQALTGDASVRWGMNVFFLDSAGSYIRHSPVFESAHQSDLFYADWDFAAHPDGGFVAAVFASSGQIAAGRPEDAGKAGADLMMKISPEGKLEAMRLIKHLRPTCCIGFKPQVAVSPNGTIYIAGNFRDRGIAFTDGDTVAVKAGDENSSEVYLASYTPKGELNWAVTSEKKARLKALTADDYGAVLAFETAENDRIFDREIESADKSGDCIAFFKPDGKPTRVERTPHGSIAAIDIRAEEGLYYAGLPSAAHREQYGYARLYLARLKGERNRNIFDRLSRNRFGGKHTHDLMFRSKTAAEFLRSPLNIHAIGGSVLIAGELFHGTPTMLNEKEPAFRAIEMPGGSAPFVLKISTVQ